MTATIEKEGITVRPANDSDRWDSRVADAPQGTVFHQRAALSVLAEHGNAELHPLVGYKGQEPVGLFPLFEISRGPVTAVFSPPPNLWVSYLGPVLLDAEGLKRRTAEKRNRRFVDACLEWAETELGPRYVHVATDHHHDDPRPFEWNEFAVTPRHTYVVDLAPAPDELLMQFSGDARRNVRNGRESDAEVREAGTDAIERIIGQVQRRHREQGVPYAVDAAFVTDLYERLPDGQVRPFVCTVDDEYCGGIVALQYGDRIDRWQGGARPAGAVDVPVNDLLDWRVMTDAMADDVRKYDLVGANERRLCEYKSKFDPDLATYFSLERGTRSMTLLSNLYKRFR